jgi:uncharacterized protein YkwD
VHRRVQKSGNRGPANGVGITGRHRDKSPLPASLTLGLTVVGLLCAFGVGAAALPDSITGSGAAAEHPPAYDTAAPGVGGAAGTTPTDPAAPPAGDAPAPKPSAGRAGAKNLTTKAQAAAAPVGRDVVSQENEVIRLTNVERVRNGCGQVTVDTKLRTAMRAHTRDMAANDYFSHASLDGTSPWARAKAAGYATPIGENIAQGQRDAAAVMNSWLASPGHRANILNCDAKAIGVALTYDGTVPIWGQLFGST